MLLSQIEEKILDNFKSIENSRDTTLYPIFAIEHQIELDELEEIFQTNFKKLTSKNIDEYWLLLILFSTEVGYRFQGMEYWKTFNNDFKKICPDEEIDFSDKGNKYRQKIKSFFLKLEKTIKTIPSNDFPVNRGIISYPIAHALLPFDIQKVFIGDIDKHNNKFHLRDPSFISKDLQDENEHHYKKRYRDFLENQKIVKIFLESFFGENNNSSELISLITKERIIKDIKENSALKFDSLLKNFKVKNLTNLSSTNKINTDKKLDPCLQFELHYSNEEYTPKIKIKNFTSDILKKKNDQLYQLIINSEIFFPFHSEELQLEKFKKDRNSLTITKWPESYRDILNIKPENNELGEPEQNIFNNTFDHSNFERILFEQSESNILIEKKYQNFTSGKKYILLSKDELDFSQEEFISRIKIKNDVIYGYKLHIPETINHNINSFFSRQGIKIDFRPEIIPVGFMPLSESTDEGFEFVFKKNETPIFNLKCNHEVEKYSLVNKVNPKEFCVSKPGNNFIFTLNNLQYGKNYILLRSEINYLNNKKVLETQINIDIRDDFILKNDYLGIRLSPDENIIEFDDILSGKLRILQNEEMEEVFEVQIYLRNHEGVRSEIESKEISGTDNYLTFSKKEKIEIYGCSNIELKIFIKNKKEIGFKRVVKNNDPKPVHWFTDGENLKLINNEYDSEDISYKFYKRETPCNFEKKLDDSEIVLKDFSSGLFEAKIGKELHTFRYFKSDAITLNNLTGTEGFEYIEFKDYGSLMNFFERWIQLDSPNTDRSSFWNWGERYYLYRRSIIKDFYQNFVSVIFSSDLNDNNESQKKWLDFEKKINLSFRENYGSHVLLVSQINFYIPSYLKGLLIELKNLALSNQISSDYRNEDLHKMSFQICFDICESKVKRYFESYHFSEDFNQENFNKIFSFCNFPHFNLDKNLEKKNSYFNREFFKELENLLQSEINQISLIVCRYINFLFELQLKNDNN